MSTGLLGRIRCDAVLAAPAGSIVSEAARIDGIRLSGIFNGKVDPVTFTCLPSIADLPEREFSFVIVADGDGLENVLIEMMDTPGLIGPTTRFIVLENHPSFELLAPLFPSRVYRGWLFGEFRRREPRREPNWIDTVAVTAPMHIGAWTKEDRDGLLPLAKVFSNAGMPCCLCDHLPPRKPPQSTPFSGDIIQAQINQVLWSHEFANTHLPARIFEFIAETSLHSPAEVLTVKSVAEALGADVESVKREKHRMAIRLRDYYRNSGSADAIVIHIPPGQYRAFFRPNTVPLIG